MEKRVFYIGCKDFFQIQVAKNLRDNKNWKPVYWTANDQHEVEVTKNFPEIIFQKNLFAVRGYISEKLKHEFVQFNSKIDLTKLHKIRKISEYMLNRFNWNNSFSKEEKKELINHHLLYSEFLIEKFNPDLVIFQEVPHFVYDYILYEICKIKKIKTLIFAYTNISGFSFLIDSIWNTSKKLNYFYKKNLEELKNKDIFLKNFNKEYLRIKNDIETQPPAEKWVQNKISKNTDTLKIIPKIKKLFLKNIKESFLNLSKLFKSNKLTNASNMKIKNKNFKIFPSYLKIFLNIKFSEYKTIKLHKFYKKISTHKPNLENNYINFFLHYEPERTISPQAGLLYNQFELIKYLTKKIPNGWFLYVKEHRKTFHTHFLMREQYRTKEKYLELLSCKNIIFIDDEYPSLKLIKNAKANVTGSGTAGLESIIHLKPLMTFGYSWLNKFKFCLNIRTKKNIIKAMRQIENNEFKFTENDVKIFLKSMEDASYNMYHVSSLMYENNFKSGEQNKEMIYESILDYYNNWI